MEQSIETLQPDHRVSHYRAMASEVQYLASEAQFDEVRAQFLQLAQDWLSIADTMERHLVELEELPGASPHNWLNVA